MLYVNIIIVNLIAWAVFSYFWSLWTHKVFKPWAWLELRKRGLLASRVVRQERKFKDRVRYYAYFFAMEQVERRDIEGGFVFAGLEDAALLEMLRAQCPERHITVVAPLEPGEVSIIRENCQGEVSADPVTVDFVPEDEARRILPDGDGHSLVLKGPVASLIGKVQGPVALALIDCVEYDAVLEALKRLYPLMPEGAIIIVHSYNHTWEGVRRAVDDFLASVSESLVPLPDMYGSVAIAIGRKGGAAL
ncbi:TylF/MycF family methyltransferase [Salmonella enterica]|nr:TylF/MycF family methyltransferase [Salmonella enterica]